MECACIDAYDEGAEFYRDKIVTARKQHQCGECLEIIEPGQKYETAFGVQHGDSFSAKTCSACAEVRNAYFCSWQFTNVWEHLRESYEDISLADFETFSKDAQIKIIEMM